jgi:hypothetical protein
VKAIENVCVALAHADLPSVSWQDQGIERVGSMLLKTIVYQLSPWEPNGQENQPRSCSVKCVKWGILSTAQINRAVLPAMAGLEFTTPYAVASREQRNADDYAHEHGIERSYGGYQALLDDELVDAVYISLPNGLHHEWILKALDRGKHVLCEKSITTTLQEVREVKDVAEETGRLVMEGFMYR